MDTNQKWLDISTNAAAIHQAQELLVRGKTKVRDSRSVKEIQEVLNTLEKQFASIDFDPVEVSVRADEFERTSRLSEVAYLSGSGDVIKVKPPAASSSSDLFRIPR